MGSESVDVVSKTVSAQLRLIMMSGELLLGPGAKFRTRWRALKRLFDLTPYFNRNLLFDFKLGFAF